MLEGAIERSVQNMFPRWLGHVFGNIDCTRTSNAQSNQYSVTIGSTPGCMHTYSSGWSRIIMIRGYILAVCSARQSPWYLPQSGSLDPLAECGDHFRSTLRRVASNFRLRGRKDKTAQPCFSYIVLLRREVLCLEGAASRQLNISSSWAETSNILRCSRNEDIRYTTRLASERKFF